MEKLTHPNYATDRSSWPKSNNETQAINDIRSDRVNWFKGPSTQKQNELSSQMHMEHSIG